MNKKDINILATSKELHFNERDIFDYQKGLNVAVAFTAFDNSETWSLDPSYGELVVNKYRWGYKVDGQPFTEISVLPTHNCTREELNLDGDG